MFCIACGKTIPDDSSFCVYCGKSQKGGDSKPVEWEYKDFVYAFQKGCMWVQLGGGAYSQAGGKLEFWQEYQREILPELQKELDQGWEPMAEVGPGAISIRTFTSSKNTAFGWIFIAILSIMLFFLPLLVIWHQYAEPVEFRVPMRRRKA